MEKVQTSNFMNINSYIVKMSAMFTQTHNNAREMCLLIKFCIVVVQLYTKADIYIHITWGICNKKGGKI